MSLSPSCEGFLILLNHLSMTKSPIKLKTIIGIVAVFLALAGLIWIGKPSDGGPANVNSEVSSGTLAGEEMSFDFGSISMRDGLVRREFKIRNSGSDPVSVEKIYTSCMCTTATLTLGGKAYGPYGMAGHGFIPRIGKTLAPDEEVMVEVVFDPTAHGPAGIGRIERVVYIENSGGQPFELGISATVTP